MRNFRNAPRTDISSIPATLRRLAEALPAIQDWADLLAMADAIDSIAHLTRPAQAQAVALEPHQQRVVDEKAELDARLEKLTLFKRSRTFASLPIIEQERMNTQGHLMCALSGVLGERIAAFTACADLRADGGEG